MIERMDAKILAVFTKFSHWFQRLTGKTNFFLAKFGLVLMFASLTVSFLNFYHQVLPYKTSVFSVVLFFLTSIWVTRLMARLDRAEKSIAAERVIDLALIFGVSWRMMFIFLLFLDLVSLPEDLTESPSKTMVVLRDGYEVGLVVFAYFAAVTPLPPAKSRIRKWIESLIPSFAKTVKAET